MNNATILDIYASRAFQWYKERHKTLRFDPCNRSLKFRESTGTPSPKVGVALRAWGFTPSYSLTLSNTLGSMWCDSRASSWPGPLQCLCLDSRASFPLAHNLATPFALVASPKLGLRQKTTFYQNNKNNLTIFLVNYNILFLSLLLLLLLHIKKWWTIHNASLIY
jgi:hypothetical protein